MSLAFGAHSQRCLTITLDQPIKPRKPQRSKTSSPQQGDGAPSQRSRQRPPGNAPTERAARQVTFPSPLPLRPRVAIIGGGLAGLACATHLANLNLKSCVFDTGEHGVGGRLGTRLSSDGSLHSPEPLIQDPELIFDHAAQFFTATNPNFKKLIAEWEAAGKVVKWDGPVVGDLHPGGLYTPSGEGGEEGEEGSSSSVADNIHRYIAPGGMRSLTEHLAASASAAAACTSTNSSTAARSSTTSPASTRNPDAPTKGSNNTAKSSNNNSNDESLIEVRRPMWVNAARAESGGWRVSARGKDQGVFDAVVIAHNGKCANRLSSGMGVPAVYKQLRRLKLSANWVLMVAFEKKVEVPGVMQGAFVRENTVLSWVGNNTAKFAAAGRQHHQSENNKINTSIDNSSSAASTSSSSSSHSEVECWTLISTQKYGKENKVPQETVPLDVAASVAEDMLSAFAASLGVPRDSLPKVVYQKAQLWGAALPLNTPNVPCIWDAKGRVGVAGDWVAGGGSMQAAALSGIALAEVIAHQAAAGGGGGGGGSGKGHSQQEFSCGLDAPFISLNDEQIGQFPSSAGEKGKEKEKNGENMKVKASLSQRASRAAAVA